MRRDTHGAEGRTNLTGVMEFTRCIYYISCERRALFTSRRLRISENK